MMTTQIKPIPDAQIEVINVIPLPPGGGSWRWDGTDWQPNPAVIPESVTEQAAAE